MDWIEVVAAGASIATAVAVGIAAVQLHQAERHQKASFELGFTDRYEDCISRIRLAVLLGEEPYDASDEECRRGFYDYFELCETELYYRRNGRVSDKTWRDWDFGIRTNAAKGSFKQAWADLSHAANGKQFQMFDDEYGGLLLMVGGGATPSPTRTTTANTEQEN